MRPSSFSSATLAIAAALTLASACAHDPAETTLATREPVIGGTVDTAHTSVVSIATSLDASTAPELCTGTVIAPRLVLTAGHCTFGQDASSLVVGLGPNALYPASTLAVAAVVTYPGFSGSTDDVNAGLDLGMIVLAEDSGVPSVPLYAGGASALVGSNATVVGYGLSSATDEDSRGMRRLGSVALGGACSALLSFGDAASNACHGDSGGPLLITASDGTESIAAVISFGDDLHCATPSFAVRVDRYVAWIDAMIAAGGDGGASTCGACPGGATDCAVLEGASDAGLDASAPSADAGADASEATHDTVTGGCRIGRAGADATSAVWAALALVFAARRRRTAWSTRPPRR